MPLIRVFPKKKIVEELTHLRDFEFPEMRIFTETEDRPTLVKAVCLYRKRNFENNPHIYQETKECIVELTEKSIETTREKRLHQVTSLIYKLDLESYGLWFLVSLGIFNQSVLMIIIISENSCHRILHGQYWLIAAVKLLQLLL